MTNEPPSSINKQWKQRRRDANLPVQETSKSTSGLQNQCTQTGYWPGEGFRFHRHLSLRHGTTADIHHAFQNYFSSTSTSSLTGGGGKFSEAWELSVRRLTDSEWAAEVLPDVTVIPGLSQWNSGWLTAAIFTGSRVITIIMIDWPAGYCLS